jgi:TonB family protein
MRHKVYILLPAVMFLSCLCVPAQDESAPRVGNADQWTQFSPPEGGFRVSFPAKLDYMAGSVNVAGNRMMTHEYFSKASTEYRVTFFALPATLRNSSKALLTGLGDSIAAEYRGSITSDKEVLLDSQAGRLLEVNSAKGTVIRALLVVTDSRLYRVTAIIPRETRDKTAGARLSATRFLESFKLVPIIAPPEDNTYLVTEEGEVDRFLKTENVPSTGITEAARKPVDQGVVNGRAVKLRTPCFPLSARNPPLSGAVVVKVVIDEEGKVMAAQIVRGHPVFRNCALDAARGSRFTPTFIEGKPVKVLGVLVYKFESR